MNKDRRNMMLIGLVFIIGIVVSVIVGAVVMGSEYKTGFLAAAGIGAGIGCIFVEFVFLFVYWKSTGEM